MNMLQATANSPHALLHKGILFLVKLQTSIRCLLLHRQSGCLQGQFKPAKNTWGYKNITPFRNTIAEGLGVSSLSIVDMQSEQSSNEGTQLESRIRNHHSHQWKTQIRSRLGLSTSCSRWGFFCRSKSPTPLHTNRWKLPQQETNCHLL